MHYSPSSPNVAIKNIGGASVHSAISNRTDSEHTLPPAIVSKVTESGDGGVGVKSASSYLRKGSTQISLESPANALGGNSSNSNKRGSSGTAVSVDPANSNYQPFVPDYTIKAVADVVYAKITRATYLVSPKLYTLRLEVQAGEVQVKLSIKPSPGYFRGKS